MFNSKKVKQSIHDWAFDIKANEMRTLEVINLTLEPINNITALWKNDVAYIESNRDITLFKANLYTFGDVTGFFQYYNSNEFHDYFEILVVKGISKEQAKLETIKHFAKLCNLKINSNEELAKLYQMIIKLEHLEYINNSIKRSIIVNNYNSIFYNCKMFNLIRLKNGAYIAVIGKPDNVDEILGIEGLKIKLGENPAVDYVLGLENLEEKLETQKTIYELNKLNR